MVLIKKFLGKFKDEVFGKQTTLFVGLRKKLYSYKINEHEGKKCKGIKKNAINNDITFEDYKTCLFSGKEEMRKMNIIRNENQNIYSYKTKLHYQQMMIKYFI